MSESQFVPVGDFSGWSKVIDGPGEVMAWNWLPLLSLDYAKAPLFPAVAIGLFSSGEFAVRTPPIVANVIVSALQGLVASEQAVGASIALSLGEHREHFGDQEYDQWLFLHSTDPDVLDGYFGRMCEMMDRLKEGQA